MVWQCPNIYLFKFTIIVGLKINGCQNYFIGKKQ